CSQRYWGLVVPCRHNTAIGVADMPDMGTAATATKAAVMDTMAISTTAMGTGAVTTMAAPMAGAAGTPVGRAVGGTTASGRTRPAITAGREAPGTTALRIPGRPVPATVGTAAP